LGNDPEAAKYALSVYPRTEHETEEFVKRDLSDIESKNIVGELDGEPAGYVSMWWRNAGRDRHVAWLAIGVRRKCWGRGVGSGLMKEAIALAKELGCRRMMLGVMEGNERALRLYKKFGFKAEAYEDEEVHIDGSWRRNSVMGLELAPCVPKLEASPPKHTKSSARSSGVSKRDVHVRQLMNRDLDEVHRLQNCPESTKSTHRIPPVTKEETKRWYEKIGFGEGTYCHACFKGDKMVGYLLFKAYRLPFSCLKFEEVIVDAHGKPSEAAEALIDAIKAFRERYWYHRAFVYVPETSAPVLRALEHQGFRRTGAMKDYYFINGYYVNAASYEFP
jgi:RimJ/RimL family protein N-acetyltransferase